MTHRHAAAHPAFRFHPGTRGHARSWIVRAVFDRFLLFPIGAAAALVWANTAAESYFRFAHSLNFAVNEIGMALFFALLTQEIVEATMPGGALDSWRARGVPVIAAAGGVMGAAGVYLGIVYYQHEIMIGPAWPIACAIDVAATYSVLKAIAPRHGVLPFALLLGIATDIFGMLVVAPRYLVVEERVGGATLIMLALLLAMGMRTLKVRRFWPYLFICGPLAWVAFYWEGLHPAFALVPIVLFLPHEPRSLDVFADPVDDDAVHHAEHAWHIVAQVVMFFFGLVNAGVIVQGFEVGAGAILAAELVGRPLGILTAVACAVAAGLHLPRHMEWRELVVVAIATSSGFTIALFFATGLLAPGPVLAQAKMGIISSACGAVLAFAAAWILGIWRTSRA